MISNEEPSLSKDKINDVYYNALMTSYRYFLYQFLSDIYCKLHVIYFARSLIILLQEAVMNHQRHIMNDWLQTG